MNKINGREVIPITPLEGAVALLAAKCRALISAFAALLDEDEQAIQEAVSKSLAIQESSRLREDDVEREEAKARLQELDLPTKTVLRHSTQPVHLSPAKLQQIRRYKTNHTAREVAERFQLTESQALYAIYGRKNKGQKARSAPGNGHLSDAQLQEIKSRLIAGQSPADISQHMGISLATVYKYKNQFGDVLDEQTKATQSNS